MVGKVLVFLLSFATVALSEPIDHTVHQVRLRCDGKFRSATRYQRTADTAVSHPVRAMSSDICVADGLEITVARTDYMPGTPMELKDFVKQSAAAMGRRPGVTKPMQSTAWVTVSKLPAQRLSFSARVENKPLTVESVYFLKDQTLWTIQIVFETNEEKRNMAERILASVQHQVMP
jgi:hypothetical protein